MLVTMTARLVRSHGKDEAPLPGGGRIEYTPATHGIYQGALRGTDTVVAEIEEGVAEPVELTPGTWRVYVRPKVGAAWPTFLVELTEGMPEPVDLVDLAPVLVVDGEKWAEGKQGLSAYDVARQAGFTGTIAAWLATLHGEDGHTPAFTWDGTTLAIDGLPGPDLTGPRGTTAWADLTGKPSTYPPATHTHALTDVPGLQAIIDRLTYDSGWRALCRWSGGAVTEGDLPAGLTPRSSAPGGVFVRRYPATVSVAVVEANVTAINPRINLPSGFRGSTGVPYPAVPIYYRDANLDAKIANAEFGSGFVRYRDVPAGATLSAAGTGGYGVMTTVPSEDSLPTSLPGTPA